MKKGAAIRAARFALGLAMAGMVVGASTAAEELKIVDVTSGKPPSDAVVLFDGGSTDAFLNVKGTPCQWPVVEGAMVVKDGFIVSKLHFRDAQIHVEFAVPDEGKKGGWAGNSGVYIFGMYEMQILDSYNNPVDPKEALGALYGISPPLVNAARKPREWQVYDIIYTAPRRDEKGKVTQPGEITAMLNGVLVQHKAHFTESVSRWNPLVYQTTAYTDKVRSSILKTDCGPLFLQDHHGSPVRFRNIWIRPLDASASIFKADSREAPAAAPSAQDVLAQTLQRSMIWSAPAAAEGPLFAAFRRKFTLPAAPRGARLGIFADSRYLLWINGRYVQRGPCRFQPNGPEYDLLDIGKELRAGENVVLIWVLHGNNGKMMAHPPGLTARLEWTNPDGAAGVLPTDETWKCSEKTRYGVPGIDWANVDDRIDARVEDGDCTQASYDDRAWKPAVKIDGGQWGPLVPRSLPLLRGTPLEPQPTGGRKLPLTLSAGQSVNFDLGRLVQAYTVLELEAEAGSRLELGYADITYTARAGRQTYASSDTHAFRAGAIKVLSGQVTLHRWNLVEWLYPFDCVGRFACSDPMLERLWRVCARSVQVLSEDAYVDCAERERVEWMDCDPPAFDMTRVALAGPAADGGKVYADARLLREMVRRTALTLQPEGWVKAHTCSSRFDIHAKMEDRACDWVEGTRRYYESTGDAGVIREIWPAIATQMKWFLDRRTPRGLVRAREWVVWGNPMGYQTLEGAGLNAFVYKALVDAAYLGRQIGQQQQAAELEKAATQLAAAFNEVLWDEKAGTYYSGYDENAQNHRVAPTWYPALFALDQEIVPQSRKQQVTRYLLSHCGSGGQIMSVYYLFKQMYAQDDPDLDRKVLDNIRKQWLAMSQWEWQTSWEDFGGGSKAHVYGLYPGYFLSAYVLGVRLDGPVWNRRLLIEPRLGDLKFAEGVVVTEFGPVPVSWKRQDRELVFGLEVPQGIQATLRLPEGDAATLVLDRQKASAGVQGRYVAVSLGPGRHEGRLVVKPPPAAPLGADVSDVQTP